jgi:hypothetical protein
VEERDIASTITTTNHPQNRIIGSFSPLPPLRIYSFYDLLFSSQCQRSQCSLSSQANSKPKSGSTPSATPPHASSLSLSSRPRAPTRLLNLPRTMSTLHLPASQVLCTRVKSPTAYLSSDGAFQLRSLGNSSSTSIPIYYSWAIGLKTARSSRGWVRIGIETLWIDPTLSQGW